MGFFKKLKKKEGLLVIVFNGEGLLVVCVCCLVEGKLVVCLVSLVVVDKGVGVVLLEKVVRELYVLSYCCVILL